MPLLAPVTKRAWTEHAAARVAASVDEAFRLATTPHRGPVFVDFPLEAIYGEATAGLPRRRPVRAGAARRRGRGQDRRAARGRRAAPSSCSAPTCGWAARRPPPGMCAEALRLPGDRQRPGPRRAPGRSLAAGHPGPLARLRRGRPGDRGRGPAGLPAALRLVRPEGRARRRRPRGRLPRRHRDALPAGGLRVRRPVPVLHRPHRRVRRPPRGRHGVAGAAARHGAGRRRRRTPRCWRARPPRSTRCASTANCCASSTTTRWSSATAATSSPSPAASSSRPSRAAGSTRAPTAAWAPASATRMAARLAHPASQVVLMLGDGAAGLSLMDVDTLVRHNLPVVMIVGNNSAWGLEKGPMQAVYGYDVAADLRPGTRYDEVVRALGGAGELVTKPGRDRVRAAARLRLVRPVPDQRDHRRQGRVPAHHHRRVPYAPEGRPRPYTDVTQARPRIRIGGSRREDQAAEGVDDPGVVLGRPCRAAAARPPPPPGRGPPGCPPGRRRRWRHG